LEGDGINFVIKNVLTRIGPIDTALSILYYAVTFYSYRRLPQPPPSLLLILTGYFENYKEKLRYCIIDRYFYYKHSDSRVWQNLNITEGYRENRPDRTEELLLIEILES